MNSAIIRSCERIGAGMGLVAVLVCLATAQETAFTIGVGLGAAIALANFVALRVLVTKALSRNAVRRAGPWVILFSLKIVLLGVIVWAILAFVGADATGLLVGVSTVFAAVIGISLLMGVVNPDSLVVDGDEVPQNGTDSTQV